LNELTFDEVFVSDNRVLGTIGDGWMQATSELAFERSGPERYLSTFALFVELVRNYRGSNSSLATLAVGRLLAQLTTARHLTYVVAGMIESGESPRVLSALAKDVGTQFEREVIDVSRSLSGARSTSDCSLQHLLDQATLSAPAFTIRGGATEILRSIVSKELQPS
jgi:alkylation response protein AidB-like acyl-CoA dehydrogenase